MENMDDNVKKIVIEHPESGTEIAFNDERQLKETHDSLQMEYLAALEAQDDKKADELLVKINEISEKMGWEEEIRPAA
jgi:hypothetical protein